jgi:hypothetical protein
VVHMEKMRTAYRILLRKAVRERPPGDFGVWGYHAYVYNLHIPSFKLNVQPLNPNVAVDGQSYFCFKCPCLHSHRTVLFLLAVKSSV